MDKTKEALKFSTKVVPKIGIAALLDEFPAGSELDKKLQEQLNAIRGQ